MKKGKIYTWNRNNKKILLSLQVHFYKTKSYKKYIKISRNNYRKNSGPSFTKQHKKKLVSNSRFEKKKRIKS